MRLIRRSVFSLGQTAGSHRGDARADFEARSECPKQTRHAGAQFFHAQPGAALTLDFFQSTPRVIVATLQPSTYMAILTGKNGTTGVGLVEIYDNDAAADSELANISTRGFVQLGPNVMIGGFVLGNNIDPTHIAVRGIGPSLSQFGLTNLLADPTLTLHDENGTILISNDDWTDDPVTATELFARGLAPQDPKESGIFTLLPPGTFTAILGGKDGGIGVIEIYNVK